VDELAESLPSVVSSGDVFLVDETVLHLHRNRLSNSVPIDRIIQIQASETSKSYYELGATIKDLINTGFSKPSRLVAIGGGVIQDICSFIASILFRGVEWIFCPTTLLAQGDSCIGGKSSVNFAGYKNLLGSFRPPSMIFIDTGFLKTLPADQIASGLGEILHFLVYSSEQDFKFMADNLDRFRLDMEMMQALILKSLTIKKTVVEQDEFDIGPRQLFNYGHSFGHALEAVTEYGIPHGIAVCFGMDIANYLSEAIDLTPVDFRTRVKRITEELWRGYSIKDINRTQFFDALRKDKKNIGNQVNVILTRGFGQMFKTSIDIDGREGEMIDHYFDNEVF